MAKGKIVLGGLKGSEIEKMGKEIKTLTNRINKLSQDWISVYLSPAAQRKIKALKRR